MPPGRLGTGARVLSAVSPALPLYLSEQVRRGWVSVLTFLVALDGTCSCELMYRCTPRSLVVIGPAPLLPLMCQAGLLSAQLGVSCPIVAKAKLWAAGHQGPVREEHRGFHKHPIWDMCLGLREAKEKNRMSFGANTWAGARPDLVWQGRSCQAWHLIVYALSGCVSVGGGGVYREGALC